MFARMRASSSEVGSIFPTAYSGLAIRLGYCLFLFGLSGCRVTPESIVRTGTRHDYQRLEIIYRAHQAEGIFFEAARNRFGSPDERDVNGHAEILPTAAQFTPGSQVVSAVSESVGSELNWSVAELRVQYPHPHKRENYARVTLQWHRVDYGEAFEQRSLRDALQDGVEMRKSRRETRRARWFWEKATPNDYESPVVEFDLPRAELDLLVAELNASGFFSRELLPHDVSASEQASQLEVRLDRRWTTRAWRYEPALDQLTTRVYEQGRMSLAHSAPDCDFENSLRPCAKSMFDTSSLVTRLQWK
jgi:hypothetical protein